MTPVEWAMAQEAPSSTAKFLLVAIAFRTADGVLQASQAELARILQCSDRSIRTALKKLEEAGLVRRQINAGNGAGRMADTIHLGQPESTQPEKSSADEIGQAEVISAPTGKIDRTNRKIIPHQPEKSDAASPEIVAAEFVDNVMPPCIGTGARAETLNLNTNTSEIYPDRSELVVGSGADFALVAEEPKRDKRGTRMRPDWRPGPSALAEARKLGIVNGWCDATLENFIDYWLGVPGAKGIKLDWDATFRNELRKEARARRHVPQSYPNGKIHEHASGTADVADIRVRGEPVSPATAARMRRQAERAAKREPIDLGRVDSVRIP